MTVYLVLFQIAKDIFGYYDTFTNEEEAVRTSERMNKSEKGKCYHFFVKVKKLGGE